jgi:hypothetical protein
VAVGHVGGDDGVEIALEGEDRKGEIDGLTTLGSHDPELAALLRERLHELLDAVEGLELVVERAIVLAVDPDELVYVGGRKDAHLVVKVRAPDERRDLLLLDVASKHLARGVLEGGEDDRAGIDERPVEVEEHGRVAHRN